MTLRGLISPPRSRSSPRDFRPHNNGAPNPPSRPNYMSPRRRPTTAEQQHTQTHRKPSATATRATKKSPPRIRPSPKPTAPIVPSRRPNPNDLHNQKKLDTKTTPKIGGAKPSSPRTQPQRLRNGVEPPRGPTPISKNTTPKPKPAIAIASASRSDSPAANSSPSSKHLPSPGSAQHHDMKNHSPYSGGTYTPLADPQLNNHLQRLSIDGKDLASIILHANSIYESIGSDTMEESFQSNAPRIFQIYKDIASHRQENSSVTSYFTKLKILWDELETYSDDVPQCCSCGAMEKLSGHVEREKVMQFLMGLNNSYSTICPQILLIQPFPTMEKAYSIIIREEKRMELVTSLEMVAAKVMENKWLLQNDQSSNGYDDGIHEEVNGNTEDNVEIPSFPNESLLIDLGSPVRC